MTERSSEFKVVFHEGVADVIRHCQKRIEDARNWAQIAWSDDLGVDPGNADRWREKYAEVQVWVAEMELSFHRCLLQLIQLASQRGELQLWWDSPDSLFFREPASGYHGGFIFHQKRLAGDKPLPVGSWSLHT
jgi:hypothetical protein